MLMENCKNKKYFQEKGNVKNIPTDSELFILECPDGSTISHTFEQIKTAIAQNKMVYVILYGSIIIPLV